MLLRPDGDDACVAIGQASHAWLSGQLARAWGNDTFAAPAPREEVCLAAEQHDIGMAAWDLTPDRHPDTGLPREFFSMDRRTHLALWTRAPELVLTQSRYAALLVSLHGTGLYERFPPREGDPEIARLVQEYLDGQRALQARLTAEVGATPQELRRNRALLAIWDDLSLALCRDVVPHAVVAFPGTGEPLASLRIERAGEALTLEPWPLAVDRLELRADGRRLVGRFDDAPALHAALQAAPHVALSIALVRG